VARVKGRRALLKVLCHGSVPCKGTVDLMLKTRRKARRHTRARRHHKRKVLIGKARFRVGAGKRSILAVPLNAKGHRLLHGGASPCWRLAPA